MMEVQNIPLFLVLLLVFSAAGLYVMFWLIRTYVLPLVDGRLQQQRWGHWLFRTELVVWALFFLYAFYRLLLAAPLSSLVLAGLLLLLGRPWWRDFLPGLLFRLEGDAEPGDYLTYRDHRYSIEALRARSLKLRSESGAYLILPYRLLGEVIIAKAAQKTALTPFTFQLETDASEEKIEQLLVECPWSAPGQLPQVKEESEGLYQVTTFAPNEEIREKQERYLVERLRG